MRRAALPKGSKITMSERDPSEAESGPESDSTEASSGAASERGDEAGRDAQASEVGRAANAGHAGHAGHAAHGESTTVPGVDAVTPPERRTRRWPAFGGPGRASLILIAIVLLIWGVAAAKAFLVPFVLALLSLVLVNALDRVWGRFGVAQHGVGKVLSTILSFLVIGGVVVVMIAIVSANASALADEAPKYQRQFEQLWAEWVERFGLEETATLDRVIERLDVPSIVGSLAASLFSLLGNGTLLLLYLLFMLLEKPFFDTKLRLIVRDDERRSEVRSILERIDRDIGTYIGLKTIISLITALPAYTVMKLLGLDFAEFWALMIFVLNFIPNVGSLIATIMPASLALVQFDTLWPFVIIVVTITFLQFMIGNVLEPNLFARRLNMSPLVVIVALVVWTLVWGVAGAFLSVPMTGLMILVCDNFKATRWIAVLLSRDGDVRGEGVVAAEATAEAAATTAD